MIAGLAAFVLAIVITIKPRTAQYLGFVHAGLEGVFLAAASLFWVGFASGRQEAAAVSGEAGVVASLDTGLIMQAVLLTFGIAGAMLVAYMSRLIRATPGFIKGICAAVIGVAIASVGAMLLRMLGAPIPFVWEMGPLGIGICVAVVVLAALMLVVDFHIIEEGVSSGAPKWMEWYAGFALVVTLVWLYVSVLRLLAILQSNE